MVDGFIPPKPRSFTRTKLSGMPSCFETGAKTGGFHETLENEDGSYYDSGVRIYFSAHFGWLPVYGKHSPSQTLSSRTGAESGPTLLGYNLRKVTRKGITDNVTCRINEIRIENV
jgi:hypothetical protein